MASIALLVSLLFAFLTHAQDSASFDLATYGRNDPKGSPFLTFESNAGAHPPQIQINANRTGTAPGYVFIAVGGEPTSLQRSPVILG